ncbi:ATP-binding protein [uncultured Acinetobacter sp.]|uniref:ATP-binding protein n=1 Tax=uncultured Acinetobacter sp. TaxID=165433 RepID=UPI00260A8B38|nr:ATP-binding protein [uncultured Acinetobacter sp.]
MQTNKLKPLKIVATADHISTLTKASAVNAISELIWNGFDASSNKVEISYKLTEAEGIESIVVTDYGNGITLEEAELYFSSIGDSWKKSKKKNYHHPLHGQNGKGRFKAFSLGARVEWKTTYKSIDPLTNQEKISSYKIIGNDNNLEEFQTTDTETSQTSICGTSVTISNLYHKKANELVSDKFTREISKKFAVYLSESSNLNLSINGQNINPKDFQISKKEYDISEHFQDITDQTIKLVIVEWALDTDRKIHLCSSKGISLAEYEPKQKLRAKGFNFTAYIKSAYFEALSEQTNLQDLIEMDIELTQILDLAIETIQGHFRAKIASQYQDAVNQWKEEKVYPYQDDASLTEVKKVEKDVFDILAINIQNFLPNFKKTDHTSKKFMFKLLAQAISENPESVQKIITEVLGLQKEEQDTLAELLDNTSLSCIISSATIVANRLNFLDGLENLLFDKGTKKIFTERDQLHKILEKEAWIFDENFALSLSEERLETVLEKHLSKLGEREDPVHLSDGRTGRIDLMLSKVNQTRQGEFDYLVVELKRPSQKINDDVIVQIKKYATAVATDERFNNVPAKWTFLAVSNELDPYAEEEANQRNKPKGLIHDSAQHNITVWAKTWSEIIANARAKLQFINKHLEYEVTQESSSKYLNDIHQEFIPNKQEEKIPA